MATRDELRLAARQHAERGLRCSAKWVAELLVSIARDGQADAEMLTEEEEDEEEQDRVLLAKAYFDTNEFQRAAHALEGARGARGRFLRWYSLFLVGEKRKEEETLEEVSAGVHLLGQG
jgi:anaphase-promoting complex subunit 8